MHFAIKGMVKGASAAWAGGTMQRQRRERGAEKRE